MAKIRNFGSFKRWKIFETSRFFTTEIFKTKNRIQKILASKHTTILTVFVHNPVADQLVSPPILHSGGPLIEPPPTHLCHNFCVERVFDKMLVTVDDSENWRSSTLVPWFVPGYRTTINTFAARTLSFPQSNVLGVQYLNAHGSEYN